MVYDIIIQMMNINMIKKKPYPGKSSIIIFRAQSTEYCRSLQIFFQHSTTFVIVTSSQTDPIYKTDYKSSVIFEREDCSLSVSLFEKISQIAQKELVYCPTSEYLNNFFLEHSEIMSDFNFFSCMPSKKNIR